MTRLVWLDEHSQYPSRPDACLIEDDVSFLHAVSSSTTLLVRGRKLCEWARAVADARKWDIRDVRAPGDELQEVCRGMTERQAQEIAERLGARVWDLPRPLDPRVLADALWGGDLWLQEPSRDHAIRWLYWLIVHDPHDAESVLAGSVAAQWRAKTEGLTARCYEAVTREKALGVLEEACGFANPAHLSFWMEFSLSPMPTEVARALIERIRKRLIESDGQAFDKWARYGLRPEAWNLLAQEAAAHFRAHPKHLNREKFEVLRRYLPIKDVDELQRLCPPPDPGFPPESFELVPDWFRDSYLPWREWTVISQDPEVLKRAREIGQKFGEWYLRLYHSLRSSEAGINWFGWARVSKLRSERAGPVTLLVVFDGLGMRDLRYLLQRIRLASDRLMVLAEDVVLAPIPTVTEFAKDALLRGLPPDQTQFDEHAGDVVSRMSAVINALRSAPPGAVIAWRLVEPDRTYHQSHDWDELLTNVESQLSSVAYWLREIVERVPPEVKLRIVLTSDHGRLLGKSSRELPVPPGCLAHGRAAWGPPELSTREEGFLLKDDIAILDARSYDLPTGMTYHIVLSDRSFVTNDGRGGEDWFPHGGLFPEELFVPWVELLRDAMIREPKTSVLGTGRAGQPGELTLRVINENDFPVFLEWVEISLSGKVQQIRLDQEVGARTQASVSRELDEWPTPEACRHATATLGYRLPSGDRRTSRVADVDIRSEALYEKTTILEDLP